MAKNKFNGYARWATVIIAIGIITYNTVATHIIAKNEIKHIIKAVEKMDKKLDSLSERLIEHIIEDK